MNNEAPDNNLVVLDKHGDPISSGTRMIEKESYERIVEGHKIAADAARHLAKRDVTSREQWLKIANGLDHARRQVVSLAGIESIATYKETTDGSGEGMSWRAARLRFRRGLQQAAGGARQMATCHRGVIVWSQFARRIEDMERATMLTSGRRPKIRLDG